MSAVLPGLLALGAAAQASPVAAEAPIRVLIIGDSASQGSAGDWTWRYRLYQHLEGSGLLVDLVGPRDDLFDNVRDEQGNHDYLDPAFDVDHAARWGGSFRYPPADIGQLVATYQPDVVVEMLGINDVLYGATAQDVRSAAVAFVLAARAVDPDVDVVVAKLPQVWYPRVADANLLLEEVPALTAPPPGTGGSGSTVVADSVLPDSSATWDGTHPNARGELVLAAAVADALADLAIGGPYPRPLPEVPIGPRVPPALTVAAEDSAAQLSWAGSPGSDHEYVWLHDLTQGEDWGRLPVPVAGQSWRLAGLVNGYRYEVMLQPVKGNLAAADDVRSNVAEVLPMAPPPGAVTDLAAKGRDHAVVVSWGAPPDATGYRVRWWPVAHPARRHETTGTGTSVRLSPLVAGARYVVGVAALHDTTPGPEAQDLARARGPRPAAPTGQSARRLADGSVRLRWLRPVDATRYEVSRRVHGDWRRLGWATVGRFDTAPLPRRELVLRVRAWHQQVPGGAVRVTAPPR